MHIKPQFAIQATPEERDTIPELKQLADILGPVESTQEIGSCDFFYKMNSDKLELHSNEVNQPVPSPLCIDFLTGAPYYRFQNNRTINQPLAKAVGIKQGVRPDILDATAGFGEDGFVLASLGCSVTMIERSPYIWALLENALRRCQSHPVIGNIVTEKIELFRADATHFITESTRDFDTIFLDPMYPHRAKSALNKQRMRVLRALVGDDTDGDRLLHVALAKAGKRVVVKRPARAELLAGHTPSFAITARSSRYDIYLTP